MQMQIQISFSELVEVLAQYIDNDLLSVEFSEEDIKKITADCDPTGEVNSLTVHFSIQERPEA